MIALEPAHQEDGMSNKLKALIVDDEPLARGRLRSLLKSEPEIELIGECSDGEMAVSILAISGLALLK